MSEKGKNHGSNGHIKAHEATWVIHVARPDGDSRLEVTAAAIERDNHWVTLYDLAGAPVFTSPCVVYAERLPQTSADTPEPAREGLKLPARDHD